MKNKTIIAVIIMIALTSFRTEEENGTVFIARKKLYTGYMGPIKVFMDDKLICQINNNAYSVHKVPSGKHKFSVQWSGKESKGESASRGAIDVEVTTGKESYLRADREDSGLTSFLTLEEVTSNTWQKVKKGLKQDDCL